MVVMRPMRYAKAPAERIGFRRISYSVSTHNREVWEDWWLLSRNDGWFQKKASIILSDSNGNSATAALSRNGSRSKSYRKPLQIKKVARSFIIPGKNIHLFTFLVQSQPSFSLIEWSRWEEGDNWLHRNFTRDKRHSIHYSGYVRPLIWGLIGMRGRIKGERREISSTDFAQT